MIGDIVQGLLSVFQPAVLMVLLIAIPLGLVVGVIPGLSGLTLLPLLIPFCYHLEPGVGLILLVAAATASSQGGSITAILLNVPGIGPSAATMLDGFPMTQQGRAGEALGAAQTASALGAIFGAIVLAACLPAVRAIIMAVGAPEIFFMIFLGLTFIAVLGRGSMLKGLISGGLGLFLAYVGYSELTGVGRFTFGLTYLLDGFKIVPLTLGIFSIPEVLELATTGGTIAKVKQLSHQMSGVMKGVKATLRHWRLVLRGSAIGVIGGAIPGVGAETVVWIALGQAKQTSKHREEFGKGCIEGVIAPESAINAKEGGALIPTLGFGIPGSAAMAILLGAFMVMGLQPGPLFLKEHLDIAFSLVSIIVVGNVIGSLLCLGLAVYLAKVAFVRGHLLAPLILIFVMVGAYAYRGEIMDIIWTLVFGALGFFMKKYGFNRPATLLGFILGGLAERYLFISLGTYGPLFFARPIPILLLITIILVLGSNWIKRIAYLWRGRR